MVDWPSIAKRYPMPEGAHPERAWRRFFGFNTDDPLLARALAWRSVP